MEDSARLVEHYDRWLEEFEEKRAKETPGDQDMFVFVGPMGFPFPSESENRFRNTFLALQSELYGV